MITSIELIDHLKSIIEEKKFEFPFNTVIHGDEDINQNELEPPYIVLYEGEDFDNQITSDGTAHKIKVKIHALCVSTEHDTVQSAMKEVLSIAVNVIRICKNEYVLKNFDGADEWFMLKSDIPVLQIKSKSAKLSAIQANFFYEIPLINTD